MGIIERKLRERAMMKKLILDAAQTLYLEKGLAFTTIRKIAERTDCSPATIYLQTASLQLRSFLYGSTSLYLSNLLADDCGRVCQNPAPVYRAWEHYIESISSIKII